MRKNVKKVIAPLLAAAMALSCTVCVSAAEDETIKLTVWGAEEDQNLLKELTDKFQEKYADQKFDIQIGVESESTAKDTILTDVEAGADVYAFADDQLPDLVKAGALLKLDDYAEALQLADTTLDDVKAANVEGAIDAATIDGSLYAFPRAADNGYFLYYDSSVISEEDAASWDSLLEAADKAGKKVGMTLASGWYNASFFYGAGFTTGLNDDGTTTMDWNGTSADGYTGVDVVKGMLDITSNPAFMAVADGDMSNQLASGNLAACVSGTWDAITAKEIFGDGYAATKLPTFTVGDKQVQQGSVAGYKYVGVRIGYEHPEIAAKMISVMFDKVRFDCTDSEEFKNYYQLNVEPSARPLSINVDYNNALSICYRNLAATITGRKNPDSLELLERSFYDACSEYIKNANKTSTQWAAYMSRIKACSLIAQDNLKVVDSLYFKSTDTMKSHWWRLKAKEKEAYLKIISGEEDISYFDTFVKEWNEQGGQTITSEVSESMK